MAEEQNELQTSHCVYVCITPLMMDLSLCVLKAATFAKLFMHVHKQKSQPLLQSDSDV